MRTSRHLAALLLATMLLGGAGCGLFGDGGSRRGGGGGGMGGARSDTCNVDLDQWKKRVRRFKDSDRSNRESFRQAKDDLVRDLQQLETAGCRREVGRQVSDLIDQVRSESF